MRAAAIDLGTVRVGLAIADELGLMAHPRPHLDGRNERQVVDTLARIAGEEGIEVFLVGLPRTLSGREGTAARRARKFAELLERQTRVRVMLVDERLSSREATQRLREQGLSDREIRSRVDSAAAAVLLQSWLDARRALP
jgi:putative Holliday junction resolvase